MAFHTRLFVGNIPTEINDVDIREAFSSYGEIINIELKTKPGPENEEGKKRFAFITLSASNYDVESCIKNFTNADFKGSKLYVTRARESFLERLQRERNQAINKDEEKNAQDVKETLPKENPVINLSTKLNPQKRRVDDIYKTSESNYRESNKQQKRSTHFLEENQPCTPTDNNNSFESNDKKQKSELKRLESLKKKRQDFKEKKMIIKTGLTGIDKTPNKKIIYSDPEEDNVYENKKKNRNGNVNGKSNTLFEDDDSELEVNFEIKTQFEGKKGQKVLDLQSRYKSDKRFTLDERFIEDDHSAGEDETQKNDEEVDVGQSNEKLKQLNILQDVLGVSLKINKSDSVQKSKPKLGMLRFDPLHPDHAKFLAPVSISQEPSKKVKKKKATNIQDKPIPTEPTIVEKVEASKEQFYKVSDTLKEAMIQPTSFSLRNLFPQAESDEKGKQEKDAEYVPLPKEKDKKSRNPLDTGEKNPFVYDSSDSECEDDNKPKAIQPESTEVKKAVWRENLFFTQNDDRLKEGLLFFMKNGLDTERQKERRGLKSVMKKRIYNRDRKTQMFQKKIGGRKKSLKKSTRGKR